MDSMGKQFKAAREKKKVSASQAALKTHIKVQLIEGMERDDFSKMPAPIYARGFIKGYCEFLDLDAAPFIKEYNEVHGGAKRPPAPVDAKLIKAVPGEHPLPTATSHGNASAIEADSAAPPPPGNVRRAAPVNMRAIAAGFAIVAVMALVVAAIKFWPREVRENHATGEPSLIEVQRPVARSSLAVMHDPPEPLIEVNAGGTRQP